MKRLGRYLGPAEPAFAGATVVFAIALSFWMHPAALAHMAGSPGLWLLLPILGLPIGWGLCAILRRRAQDQRLKHSVQEQAALRQANADLERWVNMRTAELEQSNGVLQEEIHMRKAVQQKLAELNAEISITARKAGMAEVANSVLHNVGNVLNSVNVSASTLGDKLRRSRLSTLPPLASLLSQHSDSLGEFLTTNPQGRLVPDYLQKLARYWETEYAGLLGEVKILEESVRHIREIVSRQQSLSGLSGLLEEVSLPLLVEDAVSINADSLQRHDILVERNFADAPLVVLDKLKLLQVLVNLIRNGMDAVVSGRAAGRKIVVEIVMAEAQRVAIKISDNGCGISQENANRLFTYGFTTKPEGHGFGLHASAVAAKELGGSLTAVSAGLGEGASFTVELPVRTVTQSIAA
jgi:C4-dicarboxylate-specific signal transduction histidine kinase